MAAHPWRRRPIAMRCDDMTGMVLDVRILDSRSEEPSLPMTSSGHLRRYAVSGAEHEGADKNYLRPIPL